MTAIAARSTTRTFVRGVRTARVRAGITEFFSFIVATSVRRACGRLVVRGRTQTPDSRIVGRRPKKTQDMFGTLATRIYHLTRIFWILGRPICGALVENVTNRYP